MRVFVFVLFLVFSNMARAVQLTPDLLPKGVTINAGSGGSDQAVLVGVEAIGRHVVKASYVVISYYGSPSVAEYPFNEGGADEPTTGTPVYNYYINCQKQTYSDAVDGVDKWAWKKYKEGTAKPWTAAPQYGDVKLRFPEQFKRLCDLTKDW
ncbi:hypothetical protein LIN78_10190 [Leeia sp. TBRC 13508]|uniref:Uncharacterized protein n=1 Tax=Leeia speluncae TaxID=2884804 RepID=A0ABS8D6Y2_9NEIS|nr:hypothetical protein [Leeia speluncae]MCB6183912.1 hypothetical protein [Leeia speluncae]